MRVGVNLSFQNYRDWDRFLEKKPGPPEVLDSAIYDEDIHLASLVEPLGFDSYWAIDHHFGPYVMTAGALQHLTYFAGKTSKIDVGTMIVVLPWYDPLVVCDQVAALDNLLQGRRLTLGIGRGAAIREFEPFRVPMEHASGRFKETLDILKLAISNEWFSYDGEHFKIPEVSIRPHFRNPQRLIDDMIMAWTSPQSLATAAHGGMGILMTNQRSWSSYQKDVSNFNNIRVGNGLEPTQPYVNIRTICLEDGDEAWDLMAKHSLQVARSTKLQYQLDDIERLANTKGYEAYAKMPRNELSEEETIESSAKPQAYGDPDQVFEKLKQIQETTGAKEFICNFRFGTLPAETAEKSMRLFAKDVLPRLQALEAPLPAELRGDTKIESTGEEKLTLGL